MRLGKSEVSQLDLKILSNEYIGEFEVAMDDPMGADDSEGIFELAEYLPDLLLGEGAGEVILYIDIQICKLAMLKH
jgi:hypothetical protein